MKSKRFTFLHLFGTLRSLCLFGFLMAGVYSLPAQGTGAQAADDTTPQSEQHELPTSHAQQMTVDPGPTTLPFVSNAPSRTPALELWGKSMAHKMRPAQPNRPIPAMLVVLGLVMMIVWTALLVGTILVTNATLALVLLISTIVLSPLVILGLLLVIGGIIAATSGGKKRAPKAGSQG